MSKGKKTRKGKENKAENEIVNRKETQSMLEKDLTNQKSDLNHNYMDSLDASMPADNKANMFEETKTKNKISFSTEHVEAKETDEPAHKECDLIKDCIAMNQKISEPVFDRGIDKENSKFTEKDTMMTTGKDSEMEKKENGTESRDSIKKESELNKKDELSTIDSEKEKENIEEKLQAKDIKQHSIKKYSEIEKSNELKNEQVIICDVCERVIKGRHSGKASRNILISEIFMK